MSPSTKRWLGARDVAASERRRWLLGTFAASVVFRVVLFFSGLIQPMFETGDSYEYRALARSLLEHGVFGLDGVPKMNRTPAYPAFLAAIYGTVGSSQLAVTSVQIALDALTCVLVVDLALRARWTRLSVGVVAALASSCVFTSAHAYQLMTEAFYTPVLVAAIWVMPHGGVASVLAPRARARLAVGGILTGLATLVRPGSALTIAALPVLLVAATAWRFRRRPRVWRAGARAVVVAGAIFTVAAMVVVGPWMARNRVVFHEEFEKPDHSHVTLLGFKTDIVVFRHWYTPEFLGFKRSYEEPFVMEGPAKMPSYARWVYAGEEGEVEDALAGLREELYASDEPISSRALAPFARITDERYAAAPRLHVTAPLSRALKLWIAPRVSSLFQGRHGGNVSPALTVFATAYNCLYALPGLLGLFFVWRGERSAQLAALALVLSQTGLYSLWQPMSQSRYAVPMFPILCVGCGVLVERALRRAARRRARPSAR